MESRRNDGRQVLLGLLVTLISESTDTINYDDADTAVRYFLLAVYVKGGRTVGQDYCTYLSRIMPLYHSEKTESLFRTGALVCTKRTS